MTENANSSFFDASRSDAERAVLFEITRAANTSQAIGPLVGHCIHVLKTLIPYEFAFTLLVQPDPPGIELIEPRDVAREAHLAIESLASFADTTSVSSADANRLPNIIDALREYLTARGNSALIFISLFADTKPLGVMVLVGSADADTAEWGLWYEHYRKLFDEAALQVGIAIQRMRVANELHRSEELFRALVTESPEGFWESDGLGTIRYVNQAGLEILGRSADEVIGKRIDDITNQDPAGLRELRRQLRQNNFVTNYRLNIRASDGTDKTVSQSIRVLRDANGRIKSFQGIVRDDTARERNVRLLARRQREADLLHELATRLNNPGNFSEALEKGLDVIRELTRMESVVVLLIDQAQSAYEIVSYRGIELDLITEYTSEPIDPAVFSPNFDPEQTHSLMEYLISTRRALDLAPILSSSRFTLLSAQRAGYQSGYVVPILYSGQVFGAVAVVSKVPRTFEAEDVRLLDSISAQLGLAVQNQRLVADLQRQVQQSEAISRAGALIQYAPRAAEGLPGVVREIHHTLRASYVVLQLLHQDHFEIITATDTRETRRTFPIAAYEQRILDSDEPLIVNDMDAPDVDAEQREIAKQLSLRAAFCIRLYAHDHALGILFVNQETPRSWSKQDAQLIRRFAQQIAEALENKRLLDENIHQVRALRSLVYAGRLMTTGLSPANALQVVADEIARVFPADYVSFHLREGDQLRLVAESADVGAPSVLPIYPHQHRVLAELLTTIVTNREVNAVHISQKELLARYGFVADLGVPLVAAHRALGILYISKRTAHDWSDAEVRLATLFAQQLAAAITNERLLQDSKTQVSALATLGRSVTLLGTSRSPESSLPQVARDLREVLRVDYVGFHLVDGDALRIYTEVDSPVKTKRYPLQNYHYAVLNYFQKLIVNDRERDVRDEVYYKLLERGGFIADVAVPMVTRGKAIGIFFVSQRQPHAWQENEIRVFEACAQQIATVLDNVQLLNELEARVHELTRLADLNEITATIPDLQVINELAIDAAKNLLNAHFVTLLLVESDKLRLYRVPYNPFSNAATPITPYARELISITKPLILDANHQENINHQLANSMLERGVRAALVVPLVTANETIGLVSFSHADDHLFNDSELRLAQAAANQIALAIANARLIREQKTRIEKLTSLSKFILACNTVRDSTRLKAMAAQRVCEILELKAASVRLISNGQLTPDASYGFQNRGAHDHRIAIDHSLQRIVAQQEPRIITDLEHEPDVSAHWRDRHLAEGFYSLAMLPMTAERQVIGILTLYRGEPHVWGETELQDAQIIANTLALALSNLKQMKTIDQPPAALKKRTRKTR